MSKHTSGNWKVMPGESSPRICVDGDEDWPIVVVSSGHSYEGIKANELLIAAAPDMLRALKSVREELLSAYDTLGTDEEEREHIEIIDAALRKAGMKI